MLNLRNLFYINSMSFARALSHGEWMPTKHLNYIGLKLLWAILEGNKKVVINLPPRHGKSEFISKYFIFWFLTIFRTKQVMFSSYSQEFANVWGRQVRDLMQDYGRMVGLKVRNDVRSAEHFQLTSGGGMTAVGAGGSLTGRGADLLIIDDPIKNFEEANSQKERDNLWNWLNTTALTRLEPRGTAVIVMTRWHEDDICGRIIKNINENPDEESDWMIINIPAIAEENDVLGREVGEALWSERYSITQLQQIRRQMGDYMFNAMYQQRPSDAKGHLFKRKHFRYFTEEDNAYILQKFCNNKDAVRSDTTMIPKHSCTTFAVMDLATSTSQTADYTVLIVFAVSSSKDVMLLDVIRDRYSGSEHLQLLHDVHNKWGPALIGIESVQYQVTLSQMARKAGLPIKELKPAGDKQFRALPIAAKLEANEVFFPANAHWLHTFESELLAFPDGRNDDQVDAFAYINQLLAPVTERTRQFIIGRKMVGKNPQRIS
ncbi:MAG: phage terminase large subunit [Ignavibacteria bacterium]|jgi:predicted phage terminase large subunit-like protein|nr:phage terminase large subunit [Ignavibacteria bacterium]